MEFRAGTERKDKARKRFEDMRKGVQDNDYNRIEDGAHRDNFESNRLRSLIPGLPEWRKHTPSECLTFESVEASNMSIDKVSLFSLRPCEFRKSFPQMRQYFRFHEYVGKIKVDQFNSLIKSDIKFSHFIDGLMNQIKVREEALPEVIKYLHDEIGGTELNDENFEAIQTVAVLFQDMYRVIQTNDSELNDEDQIFKAHVRSNLVISHGRHYVLPTPVFSYTKPSSGVHFLLHIMLSLGKFDTEIDLTLHPSIRTALRYAKLIGDSNESSELKKYSDDLLLRYFNEQVVTFPNSKYVLQSWIVEAAELFDSVIIHDELTITDLPAVQQSTLYNEINEKNKKFITKTRSNVIDAALEELGVSTIEKCRVPSKEDLMHAKKGLPISWHPVEHFQRNDNQSIESFEEQKLAVQLCKNAIDKYKECSNSFIKCTGIRGCARSGKTWTMEYVLIYALAQGLTVITTSHMARRAIQLGGKHIAYLFGIPYGRSNCQTPQRKAEVALQNISKKPILYNFLRCLDVLFVDEFAQTSSEMQGVLDIILRRIKESNIYMGGVLIIFTMDHMQTQPIKERPLLVSPQIIPCFQMVNLNKSVRAALDVNFQRIQEISRLPLSSLQDESNNYVHEFEELVSNHCSFVNDWESNLINEKTYRLYSKKVPAKEASKQYSTRVKRCIDRSRIISRISSDVEKSRYSHSEWYQATQSSIDQIENHVKEPTELLFFQGGHYEFTFNKEDCFSQSQLAILYDMPAREDVDLFKPVKILCAPPGIKDFTFDVNNVSKLSLTNQGFKEVLIGMTPERTISLKNNIQAKRKQYGLRHRVTNTIHGAQGETLPQMATEIRLSDPDFNLWDKGQLIVILTRTKKAQDTIFVGNKRDTIRALKKILLSRTQWTDYIENVLRIITVNNIDSVHSHFRTMNQNDYPFRINDLSLPSTRTGFVYFLISVKDYSYTYIGQTICIRERLPQHNKGYGSSGTCPEHLRPYGVLAYICGARLEEKEIRLFLERRWKINRNSLIELNNKDPRAWAREGGIRTIQDALQCNRFVLSENDLKLVLLFRETVNM